MEPPACSWSVAKQTRARGHSTQVLVKATRACLNCTARREHRMKTVPLQKHMPCCCGLRQWACRFSAIATWISCRCSSKIVLLMRLAAWMLQLHILLIPAAGLGCLQAHCHRDADGQGPAVACMPFVQAGIPSQAVSVHNYRSRAKADHGRRFAVTAECSDQKIKCVASIQASPP